MSDDTITNNIENLLPDPPAACSSRPLRSPVHSVHPDSSVTTGVLSAGPHATTPTGTGTSTEHEHSPSRTTQRWGSALATMSREDFSNYIRHTANTDDSFHLDIDGIQSITASTVQHYCYGEYQSVLDIESTIKALANIFDIDPRPNLLTNSDIDSFEHGSAISSWCNRRRSRAGIGPLDSPCLFGPWHLMGRSHFVKFYICPDYWTVLDPLQELRNSAHGLTNEKIHASLRLTYEYLSLPIPSVLPQYKYIPRIALQQDITEGPWSCGTYAMPTILHFLLGAPRPQTLHTRTITREMVYNFHSLLLYWYLLGQIPDLWAADCLNVDILTQHTPLSLVPGTSTPCGISRSLRLPTGSKVIQQRPSPPAYIYPSEWKQAVYNPGREPHSSQPHPPNPGRTVTISHRPAPTGTLKQSGIANWLHTLRPNKSTRTGTAIPTAAQQGGDTLAPANHTSTRTSTHTTSNSAAARTSTMSPPPSIAGGTRTRTKAPVQSTQHCTSTSTGLHPNTGGQTPIGTDEYHNPHSHQ